MEVLSRSFIKRSVGSFYETIDGKAAEKEGVYYQPFNPSISDFVLSKYIDNYLYIAKIISLYHNLNGINFLEKLQAANPHIVNKISETIFDTLGQDIERKELMYRMRLLCLLDEKSFCIRCTNYDLEKMIDYASQMKYINESFLNLSQRIINLRNIDDKLIGKFYTFVLDFPFMYSEIELVSSMLQAYVPKKRKDEISEKFYFRLLECYKREMLEDFVKENVESYATQHFYDLGDGDYDVDYSIDQYKLVDMISKSTKELFVSIDANDASDLVEQLDLEEIAAEYFRPEDDDKEKNYSPFSPSSGIDGMFAGLVEAKFG
jgi:hypothetical protein